jgi:rRNA maturation endonuclease Nob1
MDLKLLGEFFQLDYSFYTTPHVIGEISDDTQISELRNYIESEELYIESQGSIDSIQKLYDKYPGLSFADSSVLELTSRINGILLSSDKGLRNITSKNNLEVRGVLWIIRELVDKDFLSKDIALNKLHEYPMVNVRVPIKEIKKLIDTLQ